MPWQSHWSMIHSLVTLKCQILHSAMILPVVKTQHLIHSLSMGAVGAKWPSWGRFFCQCPRYIARDILAHIWMFDIDIVRPTQSPFNRGHGSHGLEGKNFSPIFKASIPAMTVCSIGISLRYDVPLQLLCNPRTIWKLARLSYDRAYPCPQSALVPLSETIFNWESRQLLLASVQHSLFWPASGEPGRQGRAISGLPLIALLP